MKRIFFFTSFFILTISLFACNSTTPVQITTEPKLAATSVKLMEVQPTPLPVTLEPVKKPQPLLPAYPQEVNFEASDGQKLRGYYYPSASDQPAPLVVLMHWVIGDMSDWYEIAPWLQNRGLKNPFGSPTGYSWLDPTWFPDIPAEKSYGVFIFSFRNCWPYPVGCKGFSKEGWTLDAQAALQKAAELEGVDPERISAIGSSVGADAVVAACALVNEQQTGSCKGALSLSPCNCLKLTYRNTVEMMSKSPGSPKVWCFADEKDILKCKLAEGVGNPDFSIFEFPGGGHGYYLFRSIVEPSAMQGVLDFLDATIGY